MQTFTSFWNQAMSLGTLAGIFVCIALLYSLVLPDSKFGAGITKFIHKYILGIGFIISLAAMVSSLIYSNVIGYPPCLLCWYLRIAFYPQVLLFAMAMFKKDKKVIDYALGLSLFGLLISIYHVISENIGYSVLPCEASGPSCLTKYVYEYGFITIPVMGLVSLGTLFLILLVAKRASKKEVTAE